MPVHFNKAACDRILFRDEHRIRKEWQPGYCSFCHEKKIRSECPNWRKMMIHPEDEARDTRDYQPVHPENV